MAPNLKIIHLVCACLFLGNVIVSGVWALLAERTRNHAIIQFSNRMVLITDALFTLVGAVGVVWTGHGMALRTDMRGALMVRRRRRSLNRMGGRSLAAPAKTQKKAAGICIPTAFFAIAC